MLGVQVNREYKSVDFQRGVSVLRMAAYAEATERFVEIPGIVEIRWVGLALPNEGLMSLHGM